MSLETSFQSANECYFNGDADQAQRLNAVILKENPNYAPALFLEAQMAQSNGLSAKKSIILFSKAVENDPQNQEYLATRAELYLLADFDEVVAYGFDRDKKYLHKALEDADKVIEIDILSVYGAQAYEIRSKAHVSLEQYEDAINDWEMCRCVSESHTNIALSLIGQIKTESMKDYEGALVAYDEFVAYNENGGTYASDISKAEAYYYRGKLKIEHLNQKESGLSDLKIASKPGTSDFYTEEYESYK